MKKIINFFKTLLYGIAPALAGGAIVLDIYYVIKNIQRISTGSGWGVILYFAFGIVELILSIALLYELGSINMIATNWKKRSEHNTAGSTYDNVSGQDCETSDIAAEDIGDDSEWETKKRSSKK